MTSDVVFVEGAGAYGTSVLAAYLWARPGENDLRLCTYTLEMRPVLGQQPIWSGGTMISRVPKGTTIDEACATVLADWKVTGRASKGPGVCYPRIWRPGAMIPVTHLRELQSGVQSLRLLKEQLERIFGVVEPLPANATAFGHASRQLLMLAATEVESAWKAVLRANGNTTDRLTTRDYVRLLDPMRLDAYEVHLIGFPDWPALRPFQGWDRASPTKSLPWYEAYNETKHDRETNLRHATLESVVSAMAAALIMLRAQFGPVSMGDVLEGRNFPGFEIKTDSVSDRDFLYIPAPDAGPMQPVNCPGLA